MFMLYVGSDQRRNFILISTARGHSNCCFFMRGTRLTVSHVAQVVPAPELPPDVEQQYQRFQWILFLLRKAHMQASPDAPAKALLAAGALPCSQRLLTCSSCAILPFAASC